MGDGGALSPVLHPQRFWPRLWHILGLRGRGLRTGVRVFCHCVSSPPASFWPLQFPPERLPPSPSPAPGQWSGSWLLFVHPSVGAHLLCASAWGLPSPSSARPWLRKPPPGGWAHQEQTAPSGGPGLRWGPVCRGSTVTVSSVPRCGESQDGSLRFAVRGRVPAVLHPGLVIAPPTAGEPR